MSEEITTSNVADSDVSADKFQQSVETEPPKVDTGVNRPFKITLPSQGILYEGKLPDGYVDLRPLTTAEEAILYNQATQGVEKIEQIVRACYLSKEKLDPDDLLITDRFYIVLMLRTRAFGGQYEFPVKCQFCPQQFRHDMNIAEELEITPMADDVVEPWVFTLPKCGDSVGIHLLRGKDERAVARQAKRMRMKSADPSDPSFLYRMARMLRTVNGTEKSLMEAERYVRGLEMADSVFWQNEAERIEAGVDLTVYARCPNCGAENELQLPFTAEFFRPTTR